METHQLMRFTLVNKTRFSRELGVCLSKAWNSSQKLLQTKFYTNGIGIRREQESEGITITRVEGILREEGRTRRGHWQDDQGV
eukprot:760271-Hanusia_phi.AAC.2